MALLDKQHSLVTLQTYTAEMICLMAAPPQIELRLTGFGLEKTLTRFPNLIFSISPSLVPSSPH